jgi:plasmid stability protein
MPSLTLKNVSAELLDALRKRAEKRNRSMNQEAIALLQAAVMPAPPDATELLAYFRSRKPVQLRRMPGTIELKGPFIVAAEIAQPERRPKPNQHRHKRIPTTSK